MAESLDKKGWDKADKAALGASVVAHLVLFALLSLTLKSSDVPAPPKPMTVDLITETDLESTSPDPSAETPAAMLAPEDGPIDDAPAPEEPAVSEPEPAPPEPSPPTPAPPVKAPPPTPAPPVKKVAPTPPPKQVTKTAVRRDPPKITPPKAIPKAPPRKVTPPAAKAPPKQVAKAPPSKSVPTKPAPKAATPTRPLTKAPAAKAPSSKTGTGSGRGTATRPSGDLAGMVNAVGKQKSNSKSSGAPAAKSAAQIRQSITTSIGNQVRTPWSRCSVSGIDVDALLTTVKFRLNRDGSLGGFTSTTTTGVNDSNRNQQTRHQECARKAIQQASPFTGLPPEHYDYWQNYEFKFQKR